MTKKRDGGNRAIVNDARAAHKVIHTFNLERLEEIGALRVLLDDFERLIVMGRVGITNINPFDIGVTLGDLQEMCRHKGWDLRRATRAWQIFHAHKATEGAWLPNTHTRADTLDEILRLGLVVGYESRQALEQVFGVGKAAAELWLEVLYRHRLIIRMDTRAWLAERAKRGPMYDIRTALP
jgi:hypothetical protein